MPNLITHWRPVDPRHRRIECRLNDQEYDWLWRLAKAKDRSMSAILRIAMLSYIRNLDTAKDKKLPSLY